MKVFIQSIVAQILLNPYIFWRGYQAIPPKKSWRIPYILFFILFSDFINIVPIFTLRTAKYRARTACLKHGITVFAYP